MEEERQNKLLTLTQQAVIDGMLSPEDIAAIQSNLWRLLTERTQRYTMGESSSVRMETAESLFQSILFSLQYYLKSTQKNIACLKEEPLDALLKKSWKVIESQMERGKLLLKRVTETAPGIENISYRDTISELNIFFKQYDFRFFAHAIPCDIDYQLAHGVDETTEGIEYINEYLKRLLMENHVCGKFQTEYMSLLLDRYCPNHKDLLINLYEPVAVNALGLCLLQESPFPLHISEEMKEKLLQLFQNKSERSGTALLSDGAKQLCNRLSIQNQSEQRYLLKTAVELYPRIAVAAKAGSLEQIFLAIY